MYRHVNDAQVLCASNTVLLCVYAIVGPSDLLTFLPLSPDPQTREVPAVSTGTEEAVGETHTA